jgi:hypothetical protein
MVDVTIIGGGARARDCGEVLCRSGFSLAHSFEVDAGSQSPIILGEVQGGYQLAREAMDTGRHLLIADTQVLTPERLTLLLEHRQPGQALFVWSDRRNHAGYRFIAGLMGSDNTWRPRYARHELLSTEHPTTALFRWRTLESIALLTGIARSEPKSVMAASIVNAKRNAPDLVSLAISYNDIEAQLVVGLGEAMDRRETLLASATRKAYVDELNASMPIRIIDDEPVNANSARWLSCTAPSSEELARQQCIAFLDATLHAQRTADEAHVWNASLATLASMEQSLARRGPADVVVRQEEKFRVVGGQQRPAAPSPASRLSAVYGTPA